MHRSIGTVFSEVIKETITTGFIFKSRKDEFTMRRVSGDIEAKLWEIGLTRVLIETGDIRSSIIADIAASAMAKGKSVVIIDALNSHDSVCKMIAKRYLFDSEVEHKKPMFYGINTMSDESLGELYKDGAIIYFGLDHESYFGNRGKELILSVSERLETIANGCASNVVVIFNSIFDYGKRHETFFNDINGKIGILLENGMSTVVVDKNVYFESAAVLDQYQSEKEFLVYQKSEYLEGSLEINGFKAPSLANNEIVTKHRDGSIFLCRLKIDEYKPSEGELITSKSGLVTMQ